ncbi:MAG TPA: hypothetical protein ENK86_00665 [Campylobacterales bacterium]|nr:hypothetical protein [Campylobacterales bacterium]
MKKLLLGTLLCSSVVFADSVLLLQKGWQLIGSSTPIEDMSRFSAENVEEIWHYDASQQQWLGYSPDSTIQAQMNDHNISPLTSLHTWHGFWIKSKQDWALTLESTTLSTAPSDANQAQDIIQLKEGWNLISLPVDAVVSANIFEGMTVWKYNPDREWELYDEESSDTSFPQLGHIKNSDGIWVKAPKDTNVSVIDEAAKLHTFASTEAMESYIQEMLRLNARPYCGIEPLIVSVPATFASEEAMVTTSTDSSSADTAVPAPAETPTSTPSTNERAEDATDTNRQEDDVDESDIVKHDGVAIFYTSSTNQRVNITTFSRLAAGKSDALNTIDLEDQRSIDSLYLVEGKLVVLSYRYGDYATIDEGSEMAVDTVYPSYDTQQLLVDIFDVSDINNVEKISSTTLDGSLNTSRVIGDTLYLVSQFSPQYTMDYPKEYMTLSDTCQSYFENPSYDDYDEPVSTTTVSSEGTSGSASTTSTSPTTEPDYRSYAECYNIQHDSQGYFRYDYEHPNVSITALTPNIEGTSLNKQSLIHPSRLYAPAKHQQSPTMTTISAFKISDGTYQQSNSFIGYSNVEYASSNAFYLVSEKYPIYYDFTNYKQRSMIYKFGFDSALSYEGIGSVYGYALNQFALSEYQDILRIATTEGFSWGSTGTNNSIYTLADQGDQLNIQGVLSGLGKANETIYAVRFMGDKGYVVTFEQTDPLYTLDLSDPTSPQNVGELHVNGYSSYLHPIGEDKLLGIGRDATESGQVLGLKLELFDISDFTHPSSLDSITYAQGTYSELEYNHKALAYRNSDQLFAFPYVNYGDYYTNYQSSNYLGVYQVKENALIAYDPLEASNYSWDQARGLIFDMNATTYVSFFSGDTVLTKELNTTN